MFVFMSSIQMGSLRLRVCVHKPSFWEFRFRVNEGGARRLKAIRLGTVLELPTKAAACAKLRMLNPLAEEVPRPATGATIGDLIDRFTVEEHLREIASGTYQRNDGLKYSTAYAYLHIL